LLGLLSPNRHQGFRPAPFAAGGHRQTILGYLCRHRLAWTPPTEDLVVEAEADARLLLRASWQAHPRDKKPLLIIVHGLEGSDKASYVIALGRYAWARGWHVVRMNMRGAGESLLLCARLYHAGLDADILAALAAVSSISPRLALAGFSLGGSLSLLALGRRSERLPKGLRGVAAVSAPLDLGACADALERPSNVLYRRYFMRRLCGSYRRRQRLRPDLYEEGRERGLATVREFDEAITAPYGGFVDAADYYERCSAGPHLKRIDRPTLLLASADDPLVPADSVAAWDRPGAVHREMLLTGGHVGFVGATEAPGGFWAAERVLKFLEEAVGDPRPA